MVCYLSFRHLDCAITMPKGSSSVIACVQLLYLKRVTLYLIRKIFDVCRYILNESAVVFLITFIKLFLCEENRAYYCMQMTRKGICEQNK